MMFIGNLNYVLVAVVGALQVASGALSLGAVQAFIQYSRQFSQPLTQVASMANLLQSGVASAERVFALLDATEQGAEPAVPARPERVTGRVEFTDISFRYFPDVPLIDDLSLTVQPGQTVAIVGPTGAGKTTLVNLLMRFYELDGGQITVDGIDIASMRRDELRAMTGMVLQDAWVFGGTIADNIAYGAPDATREAVIEAARATYVDRFVRTLPDGYETVLDDEGGNVSMGERQLITIARAFLARPAILILDEATSSVDTRTEVLIQRAMNSLRQGRTSFVIAHRLSTIRDADLILVMEGGRIVEQGTRLPVAAGAQVDLAGRQRSGQGGERRAPRGRQGERGGINGGQRRSAGKQPGQAARRVRHRLAMGGGQPACVGPGRRHRHLLAEHGPHRELRGVDRPRHPAAWRLADQRGQDRVGLQQLAGRDRVGVQVEQRRHRLIAVARSRRSDRVSWQPMCSGPGRRVTMPWPCGSRRVRR